MPSTDPPTTTPTKQPTLTPIDPNALCVVDIDPTVSEEDVAIFREAKKRWDSIITKDLPIDRLSDCASTVQPFSSYDFDNVGISMSIVPSEPGYEQVLGLTYLPVFCENDGTASFAAINLYDSEALAQVRAFNKTLSVALHENGKEPKKQKQETSLEFTRFQPS